MKTKVFDGFTWSMITLPSLSTSVNGFLFLLMRIDFALEVLSLRCLNALPIGILLNFSAVLHAGHLLGVANVVSKDGQTFVGQQSASGNVVNIHNVQ